MAAAPCAAAAPLGAAAAPAGPWTVGPPPADGREPTPTPGVALELGTASLRVAVCTGGGVAVLPDPEGGSVTPAALAWPGEDDVLVGRAACRQALGARAGAVAHIAQLLGRRPDDPGLARLPAGLRARLCPAADGGPRVAVGGALQAPAALAAILLRCLRARADDYLGAGIARAALLVPLAASPARLEATLAAAHAAGLSGAWLLPAPLAAAAWALADDPRPRRLLLVDVGAGGLEVVVVDRAGPGAAAAVGDAAAAGDGTTLRPAAAALTVVASACEAALGGIDLESGLVAALCRDFAATFGEPPEPELAEARLWAAAAAAQRRLVDAPEVAVSLAFLGAGADGPRHLNARLDSAALAQAAAPLAARLAELCGQAVTAAGGGIDRAVITGGLAAHPWVAAAVRAGLGAARRAGAGAGAGAGPDAEADARAGAGAVAGAVPVAVAGPDLGAGAGAGAGAGVDVDVDVDVLPADAAVRGAAALAGAASAPARTRLAATATTPAWVATAPCAAGPWGAGTRIGNANAARERGRLAALRAGAQGLLFAAERALAAAGSRLDASLAATAASDIGRLRVALGGQADATLAASVEALATTAEALAVTPDV